MIPNIFVSSTIQDLHHLRDAIRDVIADLGYTPVMSEYGDIGYLPSSSAEESCYIAVRQCQLAVLLIGRRYGEPKQKGISVTHSEFHAARSARLPVITLLDKDVMSFKAVADANPSGSKTTYPGMDHPRKVFALIDEIAAYDINNGFLLFATVADARQHLKRQLAHMVGDLLQRRGSGVGPDVKEILAEIKTLRHELSKASKTSIDRRFVKALRYLLEEKGRELRDVVRTLFGDVEDGISPLLGTPVFDDFVGSAGWTLKIDDSMRDIREVHAQLGDAVVAHSVFLLDYSKPQHVEWYATNAKLIVMNELGRQYFSDVYDEVRKSAVTS